MHGSECKRESIQEESGGRAGPAILPQTPDDDRGVVAAEADAGAARSMTFDYRLREGVATTTNALKLLELVGLRNERE